MLRSRLALPVALARPRNATTLLRSDGSAKPRRDRALIRAVAVAYEWMERLNAGKPRSIIGLAKAEQTCVLHTAKLLPLAYLAPDLVEMILEGRQPPRLTLSALIAEPLPHAWSEQRARRRGTSRGADKLQFTPAYLCIGISMNHRQRLVTSRHAKIAPN